VPTFENLQKVYDALELPEIPAQLLFHRKEQMMAMIVNLLRVRPKLFLAQLEGLRATSGNKPRTLMVHAGDVEAAANLLALAEPVQALVVAPELCSVARQ